MRALHQLFAQRARTQPEVTAIVSGPEKVSYGEFEDATNRLARLLIAAGCHPGDRVALLVPKSIAAIAGMFGALKAGCIYVPIDTGSPAARIEKILDSCEPRLLLASTGGAGAFACQPRRSSMRIAWLSSSPPPAGLDCVFTWRDLPSVSAAPVDSPTRPEDPAHILFTSGSTGVPKGVVITHSNIFHFIDWAIPYFGIAAGQRISCQPPLYFDLSTFDVYGTLISGAELHLVPPEIGLLPHKVAEFIRSHRLTQWFSVPSVLKYLSQFDVVRRDDFPSLERLLWCGEALPTPVLIYLMQRLPHVTFTNLYGPTEATIASSYYTVRKCPREETVEIPIGQPCGGEDLAVLDESLGPVPPGETGDLYISGAGLSPGYWKDPAKTNSVFLSHPTRGRIYKTGDLARMGKDGLFYLLGRADTQIKSRGYRIELGEIEAALSTFDILREAAIVAVRSEGFEGMIICCAYVPSNSNEVTPVMLRSRLASLLPPYMMPARWMSLDALPLNGNGKVDRPRLREMFSAARAPLATGECRAMSAVQTSAEVN
ncbi:MAG TPA: amino acid adenylation domain-containing protein [Bryobacteraceae bacterium]|nr:amino acid adenylation domain-containing protein [Bryobacteraceae bacterium]